jgi:hypothetical protein
MLTVQRQLRPFPQRSIQKRNLPIAQRQVQLGQVVVRPQIVAAWCAMQIRERVTRLGLLVKRDERPHLLIARELKELRLGRILPREQAGRQSGLAQRFVVLAAMTGHGR